MRVAIVGSGISGLAAAYRLRGKADVSLFEAGSYFGGHTHTVDVTLPDPSGQLVTQGVDTGFLVFNSRTYPGLVTLFAQLGIPLSSTDMSFSAQIPGAGLGGEGNLEWSGSDLSSVFAQKRNLLRPRFWQMLQDLLRFNRLCTELATSGGEAALTQSVGDFLKAHQFSDAFRDWYFLPMLGCIWSCPTDQMLRFPVATMVRFCHNHGLLQVSDRPRWHTVLGGARQYVDKLLAGTDARLFTPVRRVERDPSGVFISTSDQRERFDAVILAVHSDQALSLLAKPSAQETEILSAIRYQSNHAVLHTDTQVMPRRKRAWAAWNYERAVNGDREAARVCLHYWISRLQPLPFAQPVFVSLNPVRPVRAGHVLGEFTYEHPVFDLDAIAAQRTLPRIQGVENTWFCGAWTKYGFHEDGLQSGYRAAEQLLTQMQGWQVRQTA